MNISLISFFSFTSIFLLFLLFFINSIISKDLKFLFYSFFFFSCALVVLGEYLLETNPLDIKLIILFHKIRLTGAILLALAFPLTYRNFFSLKINKIYFVFISLFTAIGIFLLFKTNYILSNKITVWCNIVKSVPGHLYFIFAFGVPLIAFYEYFNTLRYCIKNKKYFKYWILLLGGTILGVFSGAIDFIFYYLRIEIFKIPSFTTYGFFITSFILALVFLIRYDDILRELLEKNKEVKKLLDKARIETLDLLDLIISTIEARDNYTAGHSKRVTEYALMIADSLKLSNSEKEILMQACLVHDIGKIGIPESILNKPASLTREEYEMIKRHPIIGIEILSHFHHFVKLLPYIYHHHERLDGKGYPNGLRGDNIPFLARIIAVADTFDALTSDRPYRKALKIDEAINILEEVKGTQLDPLIVSEFIKSLKRIV